MMDDFLSLESLSRALHGVLSETDVRFLRIVDPEHPALDPYNELDDR